MSYDYIDSKEYFITYSIITNAAKHFGLCTYQEIAQAIGISTAGSYMNNIVSALIGLVSENEVKHGRPMLSSIVVGVSGKPGKGFIPYAKQLGVLNEGDDEAEFLKKEREKVYKEWKITYKLSRGR